MSFAPRLSGRFRLSFIAAATAAALATPAFFQSGSRADQLETENASTTLAVRPHTIESRSAYEVTQRYVGRVVARRSSQLGFIAGGRLVEVLVDLGDRVEQDQLLAVLDQEALQATRREVAAQIDEIDARLALARLNLGRTQRLADKDSTSKRQYDEARFEVAALEARRASVLASRERLDIDIDRASLRAPYAGEIVARHTDEGTILAPGQEVLRLIESGPVEVRIGVSPEVANSIDPSAPHPVEIEGVVHEGRISAVLSEVEADTRTVTVVLDIDPGEQPVRQGAIARLQIEHERAAEGFWVPTTALSESRRGLWAAFALVPTEKDQDLYRLERRELNLIHADTDRAFVRGTLRDGERIAAIGHHRLVPGQHVRVAAATDAR